MGKAENKIEGPVCQYAEEQGFEVRKSAWIGRKACPDRFFMGFGHPPFWIEFKSPDGDLEPWQEREIACMRLCGCTVFVVDEVEYGKMIIDNMKRRV